MKEWLSIMKNKVNIVLLFLLLLFTTSIFANISDQDYIVKSGDVFLLQVSDKDFTPVEVPVSPTGHLNLYPFGNSIEVSGKTLKTVKDEINIELKNAIKSGKINIDLVFSAPFTFHVLGSVILPGVYFSEDRITLDKAIFLAEGFTENASKQIKILRNNQTLKFDLSEYLLNNDISSNPYITQNDVIIVSNATSFVRVFTNNDTLSYVQSVELKSDTETSIDDVVKQMFVKSKTANYETFTVERNGKFLKADKGFIVQHQDKIYLGEEELYVYVVGSVVNPGPYLFNGNTNPEYYIAQSGGWLASGSSKTIYIVDKAGKKFRYSGQAIKPGDVVYVPESLRTVITSYMIPISTVVSVISTIILLSRN